MKIRYVTALILSTSSAFAALPSSTEYAWLNKQMCMYETAHPAAGFQYKPVFALVGVPTSISVVSAKSYEVNICYNSDGSTCYVTDKDKLACTLGLTNCDIGPNQFIQGNPIPGYQPNALHHYITGQTSLAIGPTDKSRTRMITVNARGPVAVAVAREIPQIGGYTCDSNYVYGQSAPSIKLIPQVKRVGEFVQGTILADANIDNYSFRGLQGLGPTYTWYKLHDSEVQLVGGVKQCVPVEDGTQNLWVKLNNSTNQYSFEYYACSFRLKAVVSDGAYSATAVYGYKGRL